MRAITELHCLSRRKDEFIECRRSAERIREGREV